MNLQRADLSEGKNLGELVESYVHLGSRKIFEYLMVLSEDKKRQLFKFDTGTKDLEKKKCRGRAERKRADRMVYARRLIAGIKYKQLGDYQDAAFCFDRASKVSAFLGYSSSGKERDIWFNRTGMVKLAAHKLWMQQERTLDAAYALGYGGIYFMKGNQVDKGQTMVNDAIDVFLDIGKVPAATLMSYLQELDFIDDELENKWHLDPNRAQTPSLPASRKSES
jgi:tetratricopeptide (TPR) repeat protein